MLLSAVSHFLAGSGHRHLRTLNVWPRGHPRDPSKTVWLPGLNCPWKVSVYTPGPLLWGFARGPHTLPEQPVQTQARI